MKTSTRLPLVDLLKAFASQLIVLHHLAFYGPMSDIAYPIAPGLIDWLYDYARIAVQVFLVIGGFLAARSLAPNGQPRVFELLRAISTRYCRLALPLIGAVLLSVLAAALARHLYNSETIPLPPTLAQLAAHAFLLQGLLDQESLSAGVWYVAIDFQLFSVFSILLWACYRHGRHAWLAIVLVAGLGLGSLFYFNLDSTLDDWWMYFFGAYALGICAQWAGRPERNPAWLLIIAAVGVAALNFEFRSRIAVALVTALTLGYSLRYGWLQRWPETRLTRWLGGISYSVFLVHFPVCLLVNAAVFRLFPSSPLLELAGMGVAWMASIAAGHFFHRHVERAAAGLLPSSRTTHRVSSPAAAPAAACKDDA